jgi:hypothetical protein
LVEYLIAYSWFYKAKLGKIRQMFLFIL